MRKSYATYQMNSMFRKLAIGVVVSLLAANVHGGDLIDVWVLLTEPPLASGTGNPKSVERQQEAVLTQLQALGAIELGRVARVHNAIAVSIDQAKLPEVRRLAGVRSVAPVRDIRRDPPGPPDR